MATADLCCYQCFAQKAQRGLFAIWTEAKLGLGKEFSACRMMELQSLNTHGTMGRCSCMPPGLCALLHGALAGHPQHAASRWAVCLHTCKSTHKRERGSPCALILSLTLNKVPLLHDLRSAGAIVSSTSPIVSNTPRAWPDQQQRLWHPNGQTFSLLAPQALGKPAPAKWLRSRQGFATST